jgi:hypothetical protein
MNQVDGHPTTLTPFHERGKMEWESHFACISITSKLLVEVNHRIMF